MGAGTLGAVGGSWLRRLAVALLPPVAGTASSAAADQPVGVIVQTEPGAVAAARQVQDLIGVLG